MKNKTKKISGFMLIDILVSLGIFALVISVVVGIFVSGSGSQRKIIELYTVQNGGGYLMEIMSRELRMATRICNNGTASCGGEEDQQDNNDSSIEFTNYNGELVRYCRSLSDGSCTENDTGDYISRNGEVLSSSNIVVDSLRFYISESFFNTQPLVTISMGIKAKGKYDTELKLQNSISMRIYDLYGS